MSKSSLSSLSLLFSLSSLVAIHAANPVTPLIARFDAQQAFGRATHGECPGANSTDFATCGQGLPPNFCCKIGTICIALAANTTALCCPAGRSCKSIKPTTCDIREMNVTAHPTGSILTLALTSELPSCGNLCCPFGYSCNDGVCLVNDDQTFFTTGASPSTTVPATASSPPASESTLPASSFLSPSSQSPSNNSGIIAGSVVAALFSVITLSAVGWMKRKAITELVHKYKPPMTWLSMVEHHQQPPPPPPKSPRLLMARKSRFEWKTSHPPFKPISPVELPATPISLNFWNVKRYARLSRPKPILTPPLDRNLAELSGFI